MKHIIPVVALLMVSSFCFSQTHFVTNLQDAGTGSLRAVMGAATDGDTIRFDSSLLTSGNATISLDSVIESTRAFTFYGLFNGADTLFISGQGLHPIFSFDHSTSGIKRLVIHNMALIGAYRDNYGAALKVYRADTILINNSYFSNNAVGAIGASIYASTSIDKQSVYFSCTNSRFEKNNAPSYASCIYLSSYNNYFVDLDKCDFTNNNGSPVFFSVGYWSSNPPEKESNVNIDNCTFVGNVSAESGASGAIRISTSSSNKQEKHVVIRNSVFKHNSAVNSSGAINMISEGGSLIIESSQMDSNAGNYGGAIYYSTNSKSSIIVRNSSISNNTASKSGGAMYLPRKDSSIFIIDHSVISRNKGEYGGAINSSNDGFAKLSIFKSEMNNNKADGSGGALYFTNDDNEDNVFLIDSTQIIGNTAASSGGGLYIDVDYKSSLDCEINNSNIKNNAANEGFGGGICLSVDFDSECNAAINKCTFSGNSASRMGGGFLIFPNGNNTKSFLDISYSTFSGNAAKEGGGIAANISTFNDDRMAVTMNIDHCTIVGNTADKAGGLGVGIAPKTTFMSSILNISNSTIAGNTGKDAGAGIYANCSEVSTINLRSSIVADNKNSENIFNKKTVKLNSGGYNVLGDKTLLGSISSDQLDVSSSQVRLGALQPTIDGPSVRVPARFSVAIERGDPFDSSLAQNGDLIGSRDAGAAESGCIDIIYDTIIACNDYTSFKGRTFYKDGNYVDSFYSVGLCDSLIFTNLRLNKDSIAVSTCFSYTGPSGKVYTNSGIVVDTIPNATVIGCDSLVTINLEIRKIDMEISYTHINKAILTCAQEDGIYQWLDCIDTSAILGATEQAFEPVNNGRYAVVVEANNCLDTSTCYEFINVGIKELGKDLIHVFPIPVEGQLTIETSLTGGFNFELLNSFGQVLLEQTTTSKTMYLHFNAYPKGVYFLRISKEGRTTVYRVVY